MHSFKIGKSDIPCVGFGTFQIPPNVVGTHVQTALDLGYTHLDCAHVYQNECEIGLQVLSNHSDRNKLFITSKLWGTDHEPLRVRPACELTIKNLKCNYLDLYLVHNPCRMNPNGPGLSNSLYYKREWINETWREVEKLVEAGLCKQIGVSSFTTKKLDYLMEEASVFPTANQIETHPYLKQEKLWHFCKDNGIHITAFCSIGAPGKIKYVSGIPSSPVLLKDPVITAIASSKGITASQVLIAWGIGRGTSVLMKSLSKERILENFNAASVILTDQEMNKINKITVKARFRDFSSFLTNGNTLEDFWDGEYLA